MRQGQDKCKVCKLPYHLVQNKEETAKVYSTIKNTVYYSHSKVLKTILNLFFLPDVYAHKVGQAEDIVPTNKQTQISDKKILQNKNIVYVAAMFLK